MGTNIDLVSLSHLFNTTIFLRSIEDWKKRTNEIDYSTKLFLEVLDTGLYRNITHVTQEVERRLVISIPEYIVQKDKISIFDNIQILDLKRFFNSFMKMSITGLNMIFL